METEQINVRVPVDQDHAASKAIRVIAKHLRETPNFLRELGRFLDEIENPATQALLSQKIAKLEHQVAGLLEKRGSASTPAVTPKADASSTLSLFPSNESATGEAWASGEGRGRRLTTAGDTELRRLIDDGKNDAQIAERLGVKPYSITMKRKKIKANQPLRWGA